MYDYQCPDEACTAGWIYLCSKLHKEEILGRLKVSANGHSTEKISELLIAILDHTLVQIIMTSGKAILIFFWDAFLTQEKIKIALSDVTIIWTNHMLEQCHPTFKIQLIIWRKCIH